jgi:predicted metal-dependent enzyme (double-stranded beta helix superfamily)
MSLRASRPVLESSFSAATPDCCKAYSGHEDNIFWRRLPGEGGKLEAAGAKEPLGHNIIHSVTNPIARLTGAIHVYGGDFFRAERSEWDPETLLEERYNVEKKMRLFEEANAAIARS